MTRQNFAQSPKTSHMPGLSSSGMLSASPTSLRLKFWLLCAVCLLLIVVYGSVFWDMFSGSQRHKSSAYGWDKFHDEFDLHLEDKTFGHVGETNEDLTVEQSSRKYAKKSNMVAIGCAITLRMYKDISPSNIQYSLPLLRTLIPSFCSTASMGFDYHFYIAFDIDDTTETRTQYLNSIYEHFKNIRTTLCPREANVSLHFVQCSHSHNPAWAQNDAMMEAYLDNAEYFYRVNDDTLMLSPGWTEAYIDALRAFSPPYVGVVGPVHRGGNEFILTYDFVHRTHIDIFGYYYPRLFTDWWADDWITAVYGQERTIKLPGVKLKHTQEAGQRYRVQYDNGELVHYQVAHDRRTLNRYIYSAMESTNTTKLPKRVISMSLWGSDTKYTFGALRNAQLTSVYFPGWILRVYVEDHRSDKLSRYELPPRRIVGKLASLGAEIVYVNTDDVSIAPMMWRFMAADDMSLDCFIVRDADARLSDRDAAVVRDWLLTDSPFHCVRDHPSHVLYSLSGGMWGARPKKLRKVIPIPWANLMLGYRKTYGQDMAFLRNAVWRKAEPVAYCHDSVSCNKWPGSHPFPVRRRGTEHIGQVYDAFGYARDEDMKIMRETPVVAECTLPNATYAGPGDRNDQAVVEEINTNHLKQLEANIEKRMAHDKMEKALKGSLDDNDLDQRDSVSVVTEGHAKNRSLTYPEVYSQRAINNISSYNIPTSAHKETIIWVSTFNQVGVRDIQYLLRNSNIRFIINDAFAGCKVDVVCSQNLRNLAQGNISSKLISYFKATFSENLGKDIMKDVTHVLCTDLVLCDLSRIFNKPTIAYFSNTLPVGRRIYIQNLLEELGRNPANMILAKNFQIGKFVQNVTQMEPLVIPPVCSYVAASYSPSKEKFSVLWISPSSSLPFLELALGYLRKLLNEENSAFTLTVSSETRFNKIASHSAIIHIPFQSSGPTLCELYKMSIPIFSPSVHLLTNWHLKYGLMESVLGGSQGTNNNAVIGFSHSHRHIESWLQHEDVYQKPHIMYFDSIRDLVKKLTDIDLVLVNKYMQQYQEKSESESTRKWTFVLQ